MPRVSSPRRKPVQRERREQADVLKILSPVCDRVYVLGTSRIWVCPNCHNRLPAAHMSTRQTPGISDLLGFLKPPTYRSEPLTVATVGGRLPPWVDALRQAAPPSTVWVEVKAGRNTPSEDQKAFADLCWVRGIAHVTGGLSEVVAFLIAGGWVKADNVPHYRRPLGVGQG
jgi:hypothetical protein